MCSHKKSVYPPKAVVWATVLGSTAAGGFMLALNYWRLGRKGPGWLALALGIATLALVIALATVLPDNIPNAAYLAPQILGMYYIAKHLQEPLLDAHLAVGGPKGSAWVGVGCGAIFGVIIIGALVAWVFSSGFNLQSMLDTQRSVDMGHEQEVFYARGATREMARQLGAALQNEGFFDGTHAATVIVAKSEGVPEISFVVGPGGWEKPEIVAFFRKLAERLAPAAGGKPLILRLIDENLKEMKRVRIE